MKKIDTTQWGEFALTELFYLCLSSGDNKANLLNEGDIPLISSGSFNNGISKYIDKGDGISELFEGNQITLDMFGKAFYQPDSFYSVSHGRINILKPKFTMTSYIGRYIAAIINASIGRKYEFKDMCCQKELVKEFIKLPIDVNGDPDWAYMEEYMKALEKRVTCSVTALNTLLGGGKKHNQINVSKWQYFKVGNLFEIVKGKRLTKANMKPGSINYIGATAFNNGITAKIANDEHIHPAGTITVCYNGSVGQTFYQTEPFWATDDVNVLYPKFEMKQQIAFFIMPIIRTIGQKYAFVDKWTKDKMEETNILLPATTNGDPDFEYMEQYMRNIEKRVQVAIKEIA